MTDNGSGIHHTGGLLAVLGPHYEPIQALLDRLSRIDWLSRVGEDDDLSEDVLRVHSFDEGLEAWGPFVMTSNVVWVCLDDLGKALGRYEAMLAAERLSSVQAEPYIDVDHPYELRLNSIIDRAVAGAFREIILRDFTEVRFYHEAIDWFERGHWRCAIAPDGRRIVY